MLKCTMMMHQQHTAIPAASAACPSTHQSLVYIDIVQRAFFLVRHLHIVIVYTGRWLPALGLLDDILDPKAVSEGLLLLAVGLGGLVRLIAGDNGAGLGSR